MATDVTFLANVNLAGNELRNIRLQMLAGDPSPAEALIYYNTAAKEVRWYNGTAWIAARGVNFGAISSPAAFGQSNSDGVAATAARSDHSHALPAHNAAAHAGIKISDLAAAAANVAMGNNKITGLADGAAATDAATVGQVQAAAQGLDVKASVRVAVASGSAGTYNNAGGTAGNGQFTGAPLTVDGVTLVAGDRVLVMGSASSTGIYTVVTAGTGSNGTWNRAADFDSQAEVTPNAFTFVEEGTSYADSGWVLTTNGAITVGGPLGTPMSWTQFTGAGQITAGAGLTKTGNSLDVGAGLGISVAADTVSIDTAVVARKYSTDLTGSATTYTVSHNLGTRDVQVSVRETASPYGGVLVAWEADTSNTVKVYFASAPASGAFRATVIG